MSAGREPPEVLVRVFGPKCGAACTWAVYVLVDYGFGGQTWRAAYKDAFACAESIRTCQDDKSGVSFRRSGRATGNTD